MEAALIKKTNDDKEEKEEARSRLNELATFALVGFGFSPWRSARVRTVEKGRIRHCAKPLRIAMRFGALVSEYRWVIVSVTPELHSHGVIYMIRMWRMASYYFLVATQSRRKSMIRLPRMPKSSRREKQPDTLDTFLRCDKQHIGIWCLFFGIEHREVRTHGMRALERLRDAHPDPFTLRTIVGAWGRNVIQIYCRSKGRYPQDGTYSA